MRIKILFLLAVAVAILSGCVEKEIIDDVNIEMGVGYDLVEDDKIEGTVMIPIFNPDKKIGNFTYSAKAASGMDLIQEVQRKSAQPIVTGSLEIALFGEDIAKKGISEYSDAFQRDASIGAGVYFAVADESAKSILTGTYGNRGNAVHLSQLIDHNMKNRNLPVTNMHLFTFDLYQEGKDPYLPILKKVEPEIVDIVGIALFKDDHLISELPAEKMFFFKLLTDKFSEGSFKLFVDNNKVVIKDLDSKHKIKLTKRDPYTITMDIKIKGLIREYTGNSVTPAVIKDIEKQFETQVNKEATAMIKDFQEKGIDPVGFGQFIKTQTRGFDFKRWEDEYKNLTVHVNTDVVITEVGIIE
ncbi:Ger(x)C family spore germination protein [Bacillus sp. ISL-35]|uniref:Ger(x)C family spore germination protein n=1 Tax=Bacillus sp. ISL-35 TaxID=2819122 RepID=UPI001BEC0A9D|nr:Ger(x)C family spore germination protein [Bacillus sp. ISL-35]MBT2678997.1 Ger(x)C family spore germination protein [Bacillus sp. ISL-35]MBT2703994.1 Ger(x)C family spore germination protein [Chryseobacterium sp. ISL-80]